MSKRRAGPACAGRESEVDLRDQAQSRTEPIDIGQEPRRNVGGRPKRADVSDLTDFNERQNERRKRDRDRDGRAQAVGVSASDGAPAQAACRLARFGKLALQHAPVACTHEQLSSLHLNEDAVGPRFFFSQDCFHGQWGGLPVNVEHVSHAVCIHAPDRARPPRATNLDPWH